VLGQIRNSVFIKILWGLMSLYLLNLSVDTTDSSPSYLPEDLSINDQESIIEIVVEEILGYENAFKEYDDNDHEDHNKKSNVKIDLLKFHVFDSKINPAIAENVTKKFSDYSTLLTNGFQKLDTPPPKI
jgi:hypothetical protein